MNTRSLSAPIRLSYQFEVKTLYIMTQWRPLGLSIQVAADLFCLDDLKPLAQILTSDRRRKLKSKIFSNCSIDGAIRPYTLL